MRRANSLKNSIGRQRCSHSSRIREVFKPDAPLFRLTPETIKAKILARYGLRAMIVLPFDTAMAATTAEQFINDILFRELNVAGVVVGHDFHFGKGRGGTPHSIAEACRKDARAALIIEALLEKARPFLQAPFVRLWLKAICRAPIIFSVIATSLKAKCGMAKKLAALLVTRPPICACLKTAF